MYEGVVPRVLNKYGLEYARILPAQKGYRNESYPVELKGGQMVNVMFYKREPGIAQRIARANSVSEYLAGCGFPTRVRQDKRIVSLKSNTLETLVEVFNYLPGQTIPWEAYTMEHIKLVGQTLSNLHETLTAMAGAGLISVADEYLAIGKRMQSYFAAPSVAGAMKSKLQLSLNSTSLTSLLSILPETKALQGQQPLHMDFVRGNILFETRKGELTISGILDFEKTAIGHRLFDVARTLAFLLVDCKYKTPAQVRKYFLGSGYAKRGAATLPVVTITLAGKRYDLLESLTQLFLLHDFYKFLRHNPYEFLPRNQHFVRTRDQLVMQNMLNYR